MLVRCQSTGHNLTSRLLLMVSPLILVSLGAYATAAINNDGTRFYHGTTSFVGGWAAGGGTNVGDVSVAGTFTVLTQDLQQFKQS